MFDFSYALSIIPVILKGSLVSLEALFLGCAGATVLGLLLLFLQRSAAPVRIVVQIFVDVIRSSPFLVQLFFLYFVLPAYGLTLPAMAVAVLALVLHYGCYLSEVFRAGIESVPSGQQEAGLSLGLHSWQINALIVVPQAIKIVARPTASYFISLFKSTPYLAVVGVPDLLGSAFDQASETFRYVEPLAIAAALFLVYCSIIAYVGDRVASRLEARPTAQ